MCVCATAMRDFLKKRRFKFEVELRVCHLSDVPLVNAVLFAKVRLLDCGSFEGTTDRRLVANHAVQWTNRFEFTCRIGVDASSGILERCMCRISIRKELKSGKGAQKLGFVDVNLSEFAASTPDGINRFYLLDGYGDSQRQDNSRIQISVKMKTQNATDPVFKVPARSGCSVDDVLLNPLERKAPSCNHSLRTIPLDDSHPSPSEHPSHSHYDELNQTPTAAYVTCCEAPCLSNMPAEMTSSTCSSAASTINNNPLTISATGESPVSYVRVRPTPTATAPPSARRMSEERSRIQRTRIDAEHVIDEMLAEADIEEPGGEVAEGGGLALFIKDGGAAVLGSARYS
ncbi:hypothetical protein QR680_017378 [Steinernema hermaphroditum]|uniref:C2 NT-type domain-containing protein n=1 Tax=Steinernema hermaphroditum TaxID=289476 RepID=A0AA39HEB1_9BILA|nr:hypothetical protein QR680_017378 [Steinernema hermaphroditum]